MERWSGGHNAVASERHARHVRACADAPKLASSCGFRCRTCTAITGGSPPPLPPPPLAGHPTFRLISAIRRVVRAFTLNTAADAATKSSWVVRRKKLSQQHARFRRLLPSRLAVYLPHRPWSPQSRSETAAALQTTLADSEVGKGGFGSHEGSDGRRASGRAGGCLRDGAHSSRGQGLAYRRRGCSHISRSAAGSNTSRTHPRRNAGWHRASPSRSSIAVPRSATRISVLR